MTALEFADLVRARRVGPSRWMARCPAHDDRKPSLTVAEGERGVLVRCWAGCLLDSILTALRLSRRDLFAGEPLIPQERAEAARRSRERGAERKAGHHAAVERNRELLKLEKLADALGGLLTRRPGDDEVARLFDGILSKLQRLESEIPCLEDGPHRIEPLSETPTWIADELRQVFQPERVRECHPDAVAFHELAAWMDLHAQNETARCERAA